MKKHTPLDLSMVQRRGLHTLCSTNNYWRGIWDDLITEQVMKRSTKSNWGLTKERGVSGSTPKIMAWKYTQMYKYAKCNQASASNKNNEQHFQLVE